MSKTAFDTTKVSEMIKNHPNDKITKKELKDLIDNLFKNVKKVKNTEKIAKFNGYTYFIRIFRTENKEIVSKELFSAAAEKWKLLSDDEKAEWKQKAKDYNESVNTSSSEVEDDSN